MENKILKEAENFEDTRYIAEDTKSDAFTMGQLTAQLETIVGKMSALYEKNDELNDVQPKSFADVIPMSLDDWAFALGKVVKDWRKVK